MKICFPVEINEGASSQVYGHFGSAPMFVIVDSSNGMITAVNNGDKIHEHGSCNPIAGLGDHEVDAIVVGGIGGGALHKLNNSGLRVFQAYKGTIEQNMNLFKTNELPEFMPGHTCGGHGESHGCSH